MTSGQINEHFERVECEAADRGEAQLKDAHEAWLHGWTMAMEHGGKLEHLKNALVIGVIDDEPLLLRSEV